MTSPAVMLARMPMSRLRSGGASGAGLETSTVGWGVICTQSDPQPPGASSRALTPTANGVSQVCSIRTLNSPHMRMNVSAVYSHHHGPVRKRPCSATNSSASWVMPLATPAGRVVAKYS